MLNTFTGLILSMVYVYIKLILTCIKSAEAKDTQDSTMSAVYEHSFFQYAKRLKFITVKLIVVAILLSVTQML